MQTITGKADTQPGTELERGAVSNSGLGEKGSAPQAASEPVISAGGTAQMGKHTVLGGQSGDASHSFGKQKSSGGHKEADISLSQTDPATGDGATPTPFAVKFPDTMPVSQELLDNYQAFCSDCGLNNEQAQQAVDFYLKEQTRQLDAECDLSRQLLETGAWKGKFDERLSVANSAVRALDAQLGGRLQPMLEAGLGNNHVFAEMMACVGDLLQEESFIPHGGGGVATRSMSTEDFLRNEVFKTR